MAAMVLTSLAGRDGGKPRTKAVLLPWGDFLGWVVVVVMPREYTGF